MEGSQPFYIDVRLVAHGQVSVLRKNLVSPVAWEKWVGHWPVPCPARADEPAPSDSLDPKKNKKNQK